MAEVIIDADKRSKRHLPMWMQSKNTSKNEKLGNLDELCSISDNQSKAQGAVSMIESMSSEADVVLAEQKKNSDNKEIVANIYSKKNSRKLKKRDTIKYSKCNSGRSKRKSEVKNVKRGKSINIRHMKLKSAKSNSLNDLYHGMMEDAVELIVEDLISIAEELLTSDKEMQNEHSVARKPESDSVAVKSLEPLIPHRGEIRSFILSNCTQTRNSFLSNIEPKQTEESATLSANKIIQSGDAAQDMLELFLGPLLKKGPLKEPDPDITRELLTSTYESDSLVMSFVNVEKKAPLIKKKSSLKDKVAMFF